MWLSRLFILTALIADDHAVFDFDNAVGILGHMHIMGHDNDGMTVAVKLLQQLHHFFAAVTIQRTRRLIGKDHIAAIHQSARHTDPLLLSATELIGFMVKPVAKA